MQLRQGGSDELLAQWCRSLSVEVDLGHGVDGVVAECAQVVGVGVRVVVVVLLAAGGGVHATLAQRRVAVLQAVSGRRVWTRGPAGVCEVHHAEAALRLLSARRLITAHSAGVNILRRRGGSAALIIAGRLGHQIDLKTTLTRSRTGRSFAVVQAQ